MIYKIKQFNKDSAGLCKNHSRDRFLAERCREPRDNQIALFLCTSLTVGAKRQIAGLLLKELKD